MTTPLVSWRDVSIWTQDGEVDSGSNPKRIRLLGEYRNNGSIYGAWLASEDEMDAAERDGTDTADLGPSVEQIDWTGFPS